MLCISIQFYTFLYETLYSYRFYCGWNLSLFRPLPNIKIHSLDCYYLDRLNTWIRCINRSKWDIFIAKKSLWWGVQANFCCSLSSWKNTILFTQRIQHSSNYSFQLEPSNTPPSKHLMVKFWLPSSLEKRCSTWRRKPHIKNVIAIFILHANKEETNKFNFQTYHYISLSNIRVPNISIIFSYEISLV